MATLPSQVSDTQAQPVATRSGGPGGFGHTVALLELLLTVGYVDGVFHQREHAFIERYLDSLLIVIEASGAGGADERARLRAAWQSHLNEQYARLQGGVAQLADETTLPSDPAHIPARLKSRAVALFRGLPAAEQTTALELVRALMHADGLVSPPEQALYEELLGYFAAAVRDPTAQTLTARAPSLTAAERPIALGAMQRLPLLAAAHPLLDPLEQTFSPHPVELQAQVALDYQLAVSAMGAWQRLRAVGDGLLDGVTDIARVPTGAQFLDRHVHVIRPTEPVEVIVVGDLHGCYGCLKAVAAPDQLRQPGVGAAVGPDPPRRRQAGLPRRLHRSRAVQLRRRPARGAAAPGGDARQRLRPARQPRVLPLVGRAGVERRPSGRGPGLAVAPRPARDARGLPGAVRAHADRGLARSHAPGPRRRAARRHPGRALARSRQPQPPRAAVPDDVERPRAGRSRPPRAAARQRALRVRPRSSRPSWRRPGCGR
jgi:hypothetical protein